MKETKNIVSVVNNDMAVVNKHFFSQLKELIVYQLPMIFLLGTLITDTKIVLEKYQSFSFLEKYNYTSLDLFSFFCERIL